MKALVEDYPIDCAEALRIAAQHVEEKRMKGFVLIGYYERGTTASAVCGSANKDRLRASGAVFAQAVSMAVDLDL